jgi:hypothetical protein
MLANKNNNYEIRDLEKHLYHIKLTRRWGDDTGNPQEVSEIQMFTEKGFKSFLKFKHVLGLSSEEVIHDPTLKNVVKPEGAAQHASEPVKEKSNNQTTTK